MTRSNENISDELLIEASKWIARERADDMTSLEMVELDNLLANDIDFQLAYLEISKSDNLLEALSTQGGKDELAAMAPELLNLIKEYEGSIVTGHEEPYRFARLYGWVATLAASILILTISTVLFFQHGSTATLYETKIGDNETIMLKDGSIITLNTDTRISVALSDSERRIFLEHGEAYFDVAKDKTRPFTVLVGNDIVRAVGTAFNIKHRAEVTNVTVTEGIVEVKNNPDTPTSKHSLDGTGPISLNVGKSLTIDQAGTRTNITLAPINLENKTSWRKGMLHFKSERLGIIVREIQYYAHKEIILASDQVSDIIVGGSFNTKNVTSFLKGLERTFPIQVIERDSVIIISYKQKREPIISASGL